MNKVILNPHNKIQLFSNSMSNENNLFITQTPDKGRDKNTGFAVIYARFCIYLQVDSFTGYNGIMTECW